MNTPSAVVPSFSPRRPWTVRCGQVGLGIGLAIALAARAQNAPAENAPPPPAEAEAAAPEGGGKDKPARNEPRVPSEGEPLGADKAPVLKLQPVGISNGRPIVRLLSTGRANDQSPWRQLVNYKKDPRKHRKSYFASVDFEKGTVKDLGSIPAMQNWAEKWVDGKLYIGMNVMPRLVVYDPATDTLQDLGEPFPGPKPSLTLYRMAADAKGALALGGGTGTDLATYDPATKKFTHYGRVGGEGAGAGYLYSLAMDDQFIYGAVRGTGPWELLAIHRGTKARSVLATCSAHGWIQVSENVATVTADMRTPGPERQVAAYALADGKAQSIPFADVKKWSKPTSRGPGFTGKGPTVEIDDSPVFKGEQSVIVRIPPAEGQGPAREAKLQVPTFGEGMLDVAAMDDGRIAGVGGGYTPMVIADPQGQKNELVLFDDCSFFSTTAVGSRVFTGSYPGAKLSVYDTSKPKTSTKAMDGQPAVPFDSPFANPRAIGTFMSLTDGAHAALCLTPASDGRVYLAAKRHRYFYGFALAWCDARTLATGVFKDGGAFDHYQVGWMSPMDKGDKLLIATKVQYNKQLPGQAAEEGALFIFDVKSQKIVAKHTPLPKVKSLLGVVQTGPSEVVGVGQLPCSASVLYRLNTQTGKTEQTRTCRATICGTDTGDSAVPVRSNGFVVGPDGWVWAGATAEGTGDKTIVFRINPKDLKWEVVGRIDDNYNRLLFSNGKLYTTGSSSVQQVLGWDSPHK
jgi:hypothetical protein